MLEGAVDVRFGSKVDICSANRHVRFTPKADMCGATSDVRFGPKADIQDGYDRSSRNAIAAMLNMRVRGRLTDSDLVN